MKPERKNWLASHGCCLMLHLIKLGGVEECCLMIQRAEVLDKK